LGFRWVFLDCGHQVDDFSLRALELANELALVATATIPALANARKILEILKLLGLQGLKTSLWLNSWEKQGDLRLEEVANFLGAKISGTLQFARKEVEESINEGKPLLEISPRHPLCADLRTMAASIGAVEQGAAAPAARRGLLARWFRRG
jgi:pilus assembly protein CpaE